MFITFHLSISFCCRCRSEIRRILETSLDLVRMVWCAIFANALENRCMDAICYWQSRICSSSSTGHQILHLQGFIRPVARVGSGDPVRVLRLYTTITLDEVCSIYC